jgi:hypothetical protein
LALLDGQNLIGFEVREFADRTTGPLDFDLTDHGALTKPEMQARVLRGLIAHAPFSFFVENQVAGSHFHASAHGIAIRARADEQKL